MSMERLTDNTDYCTSWSDCEMPEGACVFLENCYDRKIYNKLREYENAEEQGLLVRIPCKVGDMVYFPRYDNHDTAVVDCIQIMKHGIFVYWTQYEAGADCMELWDEGSFAISALGKTVFLTMEEAEAALERMG